MAAARLAVKLEDARTAARTLLGHRYEETVEPWRVLVRGLCREWGCKPLQVGARLERDGRMPEQPLLLIAALVDVAEEVRGG